MIEAIALSDAPTRTERILSDRKAQVLRATTNQSVEEIPCPGQCGGVALLAESPVSVTRDGVTRTIRVAQCQDQCRMESRIGRTGKTRLVPARFDIPWGDPVPGKPLADQPKLEENSLSSRLARALRRSGLTQMEAAERIGCSQSGVSKMLRGTTMAPTTQVAALSWIKSVEGATVLAEASAPTMACEHSRDSQSVSRPANGPISPLAADKPGEKMFQEELTMRDASQVPVLGSPEDNPSEAVRDLISEALPKPQEEVSAQQVLVDANSSTAHTERFSPSVLSPAHHLRVPNPYEAILRSLLEPAAQKHLEQIAGPAASGIVVRVSLEWEGAPSADPL